MFKFPSGKSLAMAVAILAVGGVSGAMAQVDVAPYDEHSSSNTAPPLRAGVHLGNGDYVSAGAGNGWAGAAAGRVSSNGGDRGTGVGTRAPGELCTALPGTDVPVDCAMR